MSLAQNLSDPFDPRTSFQLNNRYWPGEKFTLVGVLADCEAMLVDGGPKAAARGLRRLREHFPDDRVFASLLRRVHRLHTQRSSFGIELGQMELDPAAVSANRYKGSELSAEYPMASGAAFGALERAGVRRFRQEYGWDFIRVNRTVRYAEPNDRTHDIFEHGPLSDFHNDEYKGISTIFYLSDVKEENGAFSYVEGTELIPRSIILTAIHQCVEFDMGLRGPDKLGGVPLEFRGSMAAGNFLDHDKVATLLRSLRVLTGPAGTYVMFNGQYLLHRGGKPVAGTRTAGFLQPEGILRMRVRGLQSLLFSRVNGG